MPKSKHGAVCMSHESNNPPRVYGSDAVKLLADLRRYHFETKKRSVSIASARQRDNITD